MSAPDDGIARLSISTPFQVGPVNCYLVQDDPLTLVDCGPNSGTSLVELATALHEHGHRIEDLERIVLTHQHIDHIGLAEILQDRSGCEIVALDALAPWLASFDERQDDDDAFAETLMLEQGVPEDVATALRAVSASFRSWGSRVDVGHTVAEGDTLAFAGRSWTVHHRPGHSPSDTVFHDAERRLLVAGDHLIRHISSNPLVSRPLDGSKGPRPQALVAYMDSLSKTAEMDLALVLPGHGDPFDGHAELIAERMRLHERRARKIGRLIGEHGPITAYGIARELWGNIAVTQAYLTLSEVLGHVDLLKNRGEVVEERRDGVVHFAAA